jgi:hypothetical protein
MPATCTDRDAISMKNRMYCVIRPLIVKTSTLRKSVAVKHSQWAFINVDHRVCASRSGAGPIPFSLRMLAIVPRPT